MVANNEQTNRQTTYNCYPIVPGGKSARDKKVRITFTKHTKGITITKGYVQNPVYKTLYISEKGGGITGNFC